jgi:hypothetical protein
MPDIHTDHNVYILGAGFSADAGLPLINGFLARMREAAQWLNDNNRNDEARSIRDVLEFRLKASGTAYRSNIDVENIEELFSLAAASEGESHTDYVTKAIAATLDFAQRTTTEPEALFHPQVMHGVPNRWRVLEQQEGANLGGYTHSSPLYQLYAGLLAGYFSEPRHGRNTVITFNYDTLVEDALHGLNIPFHYGLSDAAASFQPVAKCSPEDHPNAIPVLKLHGSMNWANPANDDERIRIYGSYDDLRGNQQRVLLLPPTWRKAFGGHLKGVWNTALKALTEATRIVTIGFSMPPTDTHFKYLLAAGLRDNISLLKMIFVNPAFNGQAGTGLRNNIFHVLRPELEERGIVIPVGRHVHDFFFLKENAIAINRTISPNYIRIGLKLRDHLIHVIPSANILYP